MTDHGDSTRELIADSEALLKGKQKKENAAHPPSTQQLLADSENMLVKRTCGCKGWMMFITLGVVLACGIAFVLLR